MKRWISGAIVLLGLAGCATVGQKSVVDYMDAATAARERGDWEGARALYARSFEDANLAHTSPRFRAVLHYEYGRALGVTCQFRKAEEELTAAHDLDKKSGGVFYISLAELARLNLAQKKYAEAAGYFERVLVELDPQIIAKKAPDFYVAVLEDHALALAGAGRQQEADDVSKRAAAIRAEDPEAESWAGDERTPYGTRCK
ncbi:hypothetical protein [Nitrosovibrio sp. Nv17]|uniref:hypothetical protein n=1 Tax=Nitrosovibrio sp. Nv17 TaxID=1855339 RepID=UPI000908C651|nr:hypothetical protein [Nitrosovibrio sp. Nv17]SFW25965.1 hypothetical protein SAMN05216414_10955 [Nitrosovibrio sp. Nv17]